MGHISCCSMLMMLTLGHNMNTINKITEAMIDTYQAVASEVNTEKTIKCTLMSLCQIARHNHNIMPRDSVTVRIGNRIYWTL
jgi:hypothetical protein